MEKLLDPRLIDVINNIKDESLRKKILDFLEDLSINLEGKSYTGLALEEAPASRFHHHNYPGGLIDHILSTVNIALAISESIEKIYGGKVNRDLVIGGVILHDIFKPLTYERKSDGAYKNSPLGERLDHLTLAALELFRRGFPLDLIHIVVASHGQAGPISPKTIEALICHIADEADSKMNAEVLNAAKYLVKEAIGESWDKMDSKTAFRILMLKAEGGWEGLRKNVSMLKPE
ncbi:MAG: HDIG domain-containing protein [Candidatus Bathyarchaeia archaeon]